MTPEIPEDLKREAEKYAEQTKESGMMVSGKGHWERRSAFLAGALAERARQSEAMGRMREAIKEYAAAREQMKRGCECCDEGNQEAPCSCFDAMARDREAEAALIALVQASPESGDGGEVNRGG